MTHSPRPWKINRFGDEILDANDNPIAWGRNTGEAAFDEDDAQLIVERVNTELDQCDHKNSIRIFRETAGHHAKCLRCSRNFGAIVNDQEPTKINSDAATRNAKS